MSDGGNSVPRITKAEHIGPLDTGDNIEAKRVAGYVWDGAASSWVRDQGVPSAIDDNNSTSTPLAGGQTFTGTWTDVTNYVSIGVLIRTNTASAINGARIEWSVNGTDIIKYTETSIPPTGDTGVFFGIPRQAKYYRIVYTNGASGQTFFNIHVTKNVSDGGVAHVPIASDIDSTFTALVTKTVSASQQPDGDFVNDRADGTAFENMTPLGANATFTSAWFDTDGWRSIELFIRTDQASAIDGVVFEFTDESAAVTPTVQASIYRTFTATDVSRGYTVFRFPTGLDGVRIRYVNGGVAQSSLYISMNLKITAVENPQTTLDGGLKLSDIALLTRSLITGLSTSGTYENLTIVPNTNSSGTYFSLPVVSGARPSDVPGRTSVSTNIQNVTTDTQIHTNTASKTFYLTDIVCMLENDSTTGAVAYIRDGTSTSGAIKIPMRVEAKQGSATKQTTFSHTFTEPIAFTSGVFYDEVNDLTTSITITGYEE